MNEKKIVLLIEDDPLDVISVERSIRKLDVAHELWTAYNGVEGLSLLRDSQKKGKLPDIILLDINMPKMNGIEFLKELRNDEKFKKIKVYVMTTSTEEQDNAKPFDISGYIIKPLNFNDNTKRASSMDNFMQFHLLKILENKN